MKTVILISVLALAVASLVPEKQTCLEESDGGMCRAYIPMFHYDYKSRSCKEFIYGGCGGNGNRYATEEECMDKCGDVVVFESDSDVCELPKETGPCYAFFKRFYFDKSTGECKRFIYGGCRGNGNRFNSVEECQERCGTKAPEKQTCLEEPDGGMCRAYFPMFYYDYKSRSCKEFIYGGCDGNGNRYATEEECMAKCGDVVVFEYDPDVCDLPPQTAHCYGDVEKFYFDKYTGECKTFIYHLCGGNANRFDTLEECQKRCGYKASSPSLCEQEKVTGPCKAGFRRFYFNKETGQCEIFTYGGCLGNENNFRTKEECEAICSD